MWTMTTPPLCSGTHLTMASAATTINAHSRPRVGRVRGLDAGRGRVVDLSDERAIDPHNPPAQALVVLPFLDVARAEVFAQMLAANDPERTQSAAIVTLGTAVEWMSQEDGTSGQYLEFGGGWEVYEDDRKPGIIILDRRTTAVPKEESPSEG
jgi:hypothetical protein